MAALAAALTACVCGVGKQVYSNRSLTYLKLHEYKAALQDADMAIQMQPGASKPQFRRARALLPVLQENSEEMRAFALQIVSRLTELQTARAIGWARDTVKAL